MHNRPQPNAKFPRWIWYLLGVLIIVDIVIVSISPSRSETKTASARAAATDSGREQRRLDFVDAVGLYGEIDVLTKRIERRRTMLREANETLAVHRAIMNAFLNSPMVRIFPSTEPEMLEGELADDEAGAVLIELALIDVQRLLLDDLVALPIARAKLEGILRRQPALRSFFDPIKAREWLALMPPPTPSGAGGFSLCGPHRSKVSALAAQPATP